MAQEGGGEEVQPRGISKVSAVELSGKDQRIALDEHSRFVVRFFNSRWKFHPVMRGRGQSFPESAIFPNLQVNISKTIHCIKRRPSTFFFTQFWAEWHAVLVSWTNICNASRKKTTSLTQRKSPRGKCGERPWLTSETVEALKTGLC